MITSVSLFFLRANAVIMLIVLLISPWEWFSLLCNNAGFVLFCLCCVCVVFLSWQADFRLMIAMQLGDLLVCTLLFLLFKSYIKKKKKFLGENFCWSFEWTWVLLCKWMRSCNKTTNGSFLSASPFQNGQNSTFLDSIMWDNYHPCVRQRTASKHRPIRPNCCHYRLCLLLRNKAQWKIQLLLVSKTCCRLRELITVRRCKQIPYSLEWVGNFGVSGSSIFGFVGLISSRKQIVVGC